MRRWLRSIAPYGLSMVLHGVVGVGLAAGALFVAKKVFAPEPIQVELVKLPEPVEDEEDKEPKPKKPTPRTKVAQKIVRPRRKRRRRPPKVKMLTEVPQPRDLVPVRPEAPIINTPSPEPSPVVEGPIREGPAAAPVYGVNLDSLGTGGGTFGVPAGNTLATGPGSRGPVTGPAGRPPSSSGGRKRRPVPKPTADHKISKWPERVDAALFPYPEEAREAGVEGSVLLRLDIDEEGRVVRVRLVKPDKALLDKAALAAANKLRFTPARAGGKAVPCEIRYTFTFVLD